MRAMTETGHLAALIPAELGGPGLDLAHACAILKEVNRSGGNANAAHAQMCCGTAPPISSGPGCPGSPPARCACRPSRHRARRRHDTTQITTTPERRRDHYVITGGKIYISRVPILAT